MGKIRVLRIEGQPYDMGCRHGRAYREEIRMFAKERVRLSGDPNWTGHSLSRESVLALAEACVPAHRAYAPELVEELQGLADVTGLSLGELIILNGFTDFVDTVYNLGDKNQPPGRVERVSRPADNCTAFIVPDNATLDSHGFYGQTWDMHASATPYVILLHCRPVNAPAALIFSIMGCVGIIGMNVAGIAVGVNTLSGGDGQIGVTWPFVVRKILAQTDIEAALSCLTSAKLAGAHNYLLFDKNGRGYNVEAMATQQHITELNGDNIVHTNHCLFSATRVLERKRPPALQSSSKARLSRANALLEQRPITLERLIALTRDQKAICTVSKPPYHIETCGAAIMRPATGHFWAVWGLPTENEYEWFKLPITNY